MHSQEEDHLRGCGHQEAQRQTGTPVQECHQRQGGMEKAKSGSQLFGFLVHFQILEFLTSGLFSKLYLHKTEKMSIFHTEERGEYFPATGAETKSPHNTKPGALLATSTQIPHCSTRSLLSTGELLLNRAVYYQADFHYAKEVVFPTFQ